MSGPTAPAEPSPAVTTARSPLLRALWIVAGWASLVLGFIGIFVPLLPTTPFVLLAAYCFSRGSARWEHWLVHHPRLGPMVRDWRATRAVPLRAKQLATVMMTASSLWAYTVIPSMWRFMPAACCTVVGLWLWSLPTRR